VKNFRLRSNRPSRSTFAPLMEPIFSKIALVYIVNQAKKRH
jgi:hypothetical protein